MADDWMHGELQRATLRKVAAYRELCNHVRSKSKSSLIFGGLMLLLWYAMPAGMQFKTFGLIYLGLAGFEFVAGAMNRFFPSAEGILIDGFVVIAFGLTNLGRQAMLIADGKSPQWLLLGLGAYLIYIGWSHVGTYRQLRRAFAERPTADHLRWFDGLVREVRDANPERDADALDLPTARRLRAKLLGDTAVVLSGKHDVLIVGRNDVDLVREGEGLAAAIVDGLDYGPCRLSDDNWRNYAQWKAEGQQPPTVGAVR